jgi:uncharacterized repeat protein (TIGR03803 family)
MGPSRFMVMFASLSVLAAASPISAQTVATIYSFNGTSSSGNPAYVAPAQGRDGKLYGTTWGPSGSDGSVFRVRVAGLENQTHTFGGTDGSNPTVGLTLATDGNFYGTTYNGGSNNYGVLFKIAPNGAYTVLHEFSNGSDGANPIAPPIEASDGNFYGSTSGTGGASTIYQYKPSGVFSTILSLSQSQGLYALGALLEGSDGNLYGAAELGGANGCGTLFKLTKSGTLLWSYSFQCTDMGYAPNSGLLQATDGNFYGTTIYGGTGQRCGTVFRLDQRGTVSVVYAFNGLPDGCDPYGIVQGTDGNLYGTTLGGGKGADGQGTLFQLTLDGAHTIVHYFGVAAGQPYAPPTQDTNGSFYGTTWGDGHYGYGTVYSLNMGLVPFIAFVRPNARVGGTAQILGQGLIGTTNVTFRGIAATSFTVVTDTYMTAVVPSGATTGNVVVTTPGGVLTSNVSFRVVN